MDDRQIQELVRMAVEAESLEHDQSVPGPFLFPAHRSSWRVGLAWAGAAAAGLALGVGTWVAVRQGPSPVPVPKMALADKTDRSAAATLPKPVPTHAAPGPHARGAGDERCVVLMITRDSYGDLSCVQWRPHEWGEGRSLAQITPAELLDAAGGMWCDDGASEVTVVAVSGPRGSVPSSDALAQEVAACMTYSGDLCEGEPGSYATAALSCLPAGVHAVAQTVPLGSY